MTSVEVGVYEAKTTFSGLLERVAAGEEIVITRRGVDRGLYEVPDDFDAPLGDDSLAAFERCATRH